ncbi:MAG: TIGR02302 family protein [Alphaproteobacteria bacterium]
MTRHRHPAEPGRPSLRRHPADAAVVADRLLVRIAWARRRAWLALLWEQVWRAAVGPLTASGLFLALALSGVLPRLPLALHGIALLLMAGIFVVTVYGGTRAFRWPTRDTAERRVEKTSGYAHRPLATLTDQPALLPGNPHEQTALWRAHVRRAVAHLGRVRAGLPHPRLAGRDPLALRGLVLLGLAAAVVAVGPAAPERLAEALRPVRAESGAILALDLWITPPDYTATAPLFRDPAGGHVTAPAGSRLAGRVSGPASPPVMTFDGQRLALADSAASGYMVDAPLNGDGSLSLTVPGRDAIVWPIALTPDTPPTVALTAPPEETRRGALRLDYAASDDYGLTSLSATVGRPDTLRPATERLHPPLLIDLPIPVLARSPDGDRLHGAGTLFRDLAEHPWAGLAVRLSLSATDLAGQAGHSPAVDLVLPERAFSHPVAIALVAERRRLLLDDTAVQTVLQALARMGADPAGYAFDHSIFLGLRVAILRLAGEVPDKADDVAAMLWSMALALDGGELAAAEQALRALQEELMRALADNAPPEEIARLTEELRQALDRFLAAQAADLQRRQEEGQSGPPPEALANALDSEDLGALLDRIRDLAAAGAREEAEELLAELQNLLENLETVLEAGEEGPGDPGANALTNMLRELQGLLAEQEDIQESTFSQIRRRAAQLDPDSDARQGIPEEGARLELQRTPRNQRGSLLGDPFDLTPANNPDVIDPGEASALRAAQEDLRRRLGQAMSRFADGGMTIPNELRQAEQAMGRASDALSRSQGQAALQPQSDAIQQLQEGARDVLSRMANQAGEAADSEVQSSQADGRLGRDPLGRDGLGVGAVRTGTVGSLDDAALKRAREIRDELRRRAAERSRPTPERDYLERLLRRF